MKRPTPNLKPSLRRNSAAALISFLTVSAALGQSPPAGVRELPVGKSVGREISAAESHQYGLALRRGQVLSVELEEQGFDAQVELVRPSDGKSVATANLGGGFEREALTFAAEEGGQYLLRVGAAEAESGGGRYRLSARLADSASEEDGARIRAEKLLAEAAASQKEGTSEKFRAAVVLRERALALWRGLGDRYWESYTLNRLGGAHAALSENNKALAYLEQALQIVRGLGDRKLEAASLNGVGATLNGAGDAAKALDYHDRARAMLLAEGDNLGAAISLHHAGNAYMEMDDKPKAAERFEQGLALARELKNKAWEAQFLTSLGYVADSQNDKPKALALYDQALALWPARGSANGRAATHASLGRTHLSRGDADKAVAHLTQALTIYESEKNKDGEAGTLILLGNAYEKRGETEKAVAALKRTVAIYHDLGLRPLEMLFVNALALQYEAAGKYEEAVEYAIRCLAIEASLPEGLAGRRKRLYEEVMRTSKGFSMMTLGRIYENRGDLDKSLQNYQAALAIFEKEPENKYKQMVWANLGAIAQLRRTQHRWTEALDLQGRALKVAEEIGSKRLIATTLNGLGLTYGGLGDKTKELDSYRRAHDAAAEGGDASSAASALQNMAVAHYMAGEAQQALGLLDRALALNRSSGDAAGEMFNHGLRGMLYSNLMDKPRAVESLNQALLIARQTGDKKRERDFLNRLSVLYSFLGENDKALDLDQRALELARQLGFRDGVATSLNNLGFVYSSRGERGKSLNFFEQAVALAREAGDKASEATFLSNVAYDYAALGELARALELYEQSLKLRRETGGKREQSFTLNGIGGVYLGLGEREKKAERFRQSLDSFEQSLKLAREVGDKEVETAALGGLGRAHAANGDAAKGLAHLTESLQLAVKYRSKFQEAFAHLFLGNMHREGGRFDTAVREYARTLTLARELGDKDVEAKALKGLMSALRAQGHTRLAIVYGKRAVNEYQRLRGAISNLKQETQRIYRDKVTDAYRELADLLVAAGRLAEAEQVLEMLKEAELFEYLRRDDKVARELLSTIAVDDPERQAIARYEELAERVTALGRQYEELKAAQNAAYLADPAAAFPGKARLKSLKGELDAAHTAFNRFLKMLRQELGGKDVRVAEVSSDLQDTLRRLNAGRSVIVSTIVGERRLNIIVTTSQTQRAHTVEVAEAVLNERVKEFRSALTDPRLDPRPAGQRLYDILVRPIEGDLAGVEADTILWSLDGALRYIPPAALWDRERGYVAQRFASSIITLAGRNELDLPVGDRDKLRALGVGVSKAGEGFRELPAVPEELGHIIKEAADADGPGAAPGAAGVLVGRKLLDETFTRETFTDALENYQIIHIASHFRFQPGNDKDSFLLLGGGTPRRFTVNDLQAVSLVNAELITLSACNTYMAGGGGASGVEVESFGAAVQGRGAKAVMATLWSVADPSTRDFMVKFYEFYARRGMTKTAALRQAQRALLGDAGQVRAASGGGAEAQGAAPRRDTGEVAPGDGQEAPPYQKDGARPYAHPYYWSPFVLIGNWR